MIIMRDSKSKTIGAHFIQCKGIGDEYIVRRLMKDIDSLGYSTVTLKSDGEPALVQVLNEIKNRRVQDTFIMHPPAYDPQANGLIEQTVQSTMNQFRAVRLGLEQKLGRNIPEDSPILEWCLAHSVWILNNFVIGEDGLASQARLTGRRQVHKLIGFGECVQAKPLRARKTKRAAQLEERWLDGVWLGYNALT